MLVTVTRATPIWEAISFLQAPESQAARRKQPNFCVVKQRSIVGTVLGSHFVPHLSQDVDHLAVNPSLKPRWQRGALASAPAPLQPESRTAPCAKIDPYVKQDKLVS
jgi:hypothetical protein